MKRPVVKGIAVCGWLASYCAGPRGLSFTFSVAILVR